MSLQAFLLVGFVAACAAALWAVVRLARAPGAPSRERIERLRVQGNFVPLTPEDAAEDEQRRVARTSGKAASDPSLERRS